MGACMYISLEFCKVFGTFKHSFLLKTQITFNSRDNDQFLIIMLEVKQRLQKCLIIKVFYLIFNIMVIIGDLKVLLHSLWMGKWSLMSKTHPYPFFSLIWFSPRWFWHLEVPYFLTLENFMSLERSGCSHLNFTIDSNIE